MQHGTVDVMTALHALCHQVALGPEDLEAIDADPHGVSLSPGLWAASSRLLVELEGGDYDVGATLDLGFHSLILRWLGCPDEAAFVARHGHTIADTLARDATRLGTFAEILDDPDAAVDEAPRCQLAIVWCERAGVLYSGLPATAPSVVDALERAIARSRPGDPWMRRFWEALRLAARLAGDDARGLEAEARLAECDARHVAIGMGEVAAAASARLLTILWCLCHGPDRYLLPAERGVDPDIHGSPELWTQLRVKILQGRWREVPLAANTFHAWSGTRPTSGLLVPIDGDVAQSVIDVAEGQTLGGLFEACLTEGVAREMVPLIESVWGDGEPVQLVHSLAACSVVAAVIERRSVLEGDWRPVDGALLDPWQERFQGANRTETAARVRLIEELHPVLLRCGELDPLAAAFVSLDEAARYEAEDQPEQQRAALMQAVVLTRGLPEGSPWRDYGAVCMALFCWRSGDVGRARALLAGIDAPTAKATLAYVEAHEPEREHAERLGMAWEAEPDLQAGCDYAWALQRAGQEIRARHIAGELTDRWPIEREASMTLAGVLVQQRRYRDARLAALDARALGCGRDAEVLLARIRQGLGGPA